MRLLTMGLKKPIASRTGRRSSKLSSNARAGQPRKEFAQNSANSFSMDEAEDITGMSPQRGGTVPLVAQGSRRKN
jgi:hypothetical protein